VELITPPSICVSYQSASDCHTRVHQIFALILCRKRQIIKIYAWLPEKGGWFYIKQGAFRGSRYTGAPDFIYARSAFDSCDDHLMTRMRFALMSQRLFSATIINISLDFALKWLPEFIIEQSVWPGNQRKGLWPVARRYKRTEGSYLHCVFIFH